MSPKNKTDRASRQTHTGVGHSPRPLSPEFKGSLQEPALQFLQGSSLKEPDFGRFEEAGGGGVAPQLLHDLFDCVQALQTKIKCNTACHRRQKRFAYNTLSANMSSHSLSMSRSSAIKSRDAKASGSVR